ncbi:hypothetical protein [Kitasatospora sp. NPDC001683]
MVDGLPAPLTTGTDEPWPGFCPVSRAAVESLATTDSGLDLQARLAKRLTKSDDAPLPIGVPQVLAEGQRERLAALARSYYRMVEAVVAAYPQDERLRRLIVAPPELAADLLVVSDPRQCGVHAMRIDVLPQPDGTVKVLETNASTPALLMFFGLLARTWRGFLTANGVPLPVALPAEREHWMADWFLAAARQETGQCPSHVPLLRERGGWRLELDILQRLFASRAVESEEVDLTELRYGPDGPSFAGRPFRHAYFAYLTRDFCRIRHRIDSFVRALQQDEVFVQNRMLGRWVGGSKLALAVMSDPRFADLFDPADLIVVTPALPWSRALACCGDEELARIAHERARYVLKRPLDYGGQGVVIGRETPLARWRTALASARRESWLVQEFCPSPVHGVGPGGEPIRHDLTIGVVGGEMSALLMRTSSEYRVNISRSGVLHPVFA